MADDFEVYQGDDIIPYFAVVDENGDPIDLSVWTAATWVATPASTTTPTIKKHKSDMTLDVDPTNPSAMVDNCIFVPLTSADTGGSSDVGQFRHELRITYNSLQVVVYPPIGTTATFTIVPSLTWDSGAPTPAPRIPVEDTTRAIRTMRPTSPKAPSYLHFKKTRP